MSLGKCLKSLIAFSLLVGVWSGVEAQPITFKAEMTDIGGVPVESGDLLSLDERTNRFSLGFSIEVIDNKADPTLTVGVGLTDNDAISGALPDATASAADALLDEFVTQKGLALGVLPSGGTSRIFGAIQIGDENTPPSATGDIDPKSLSVVNNNGELTITGTIILSATADSHTGVTLFAFAKDPTFEGEQFSGARISSPLVKIRVDANYLSVKDVKIRSAEIVRIEEREDVLVRGFVDGKVRAAAGIGDKLRIEVEVINESKNPVFFPDASIADGRDALGLELFVFGELIEVDPANRTADGKALFAEIDLNAGSVGPIQLTPDQAGSIVIEAGLRNLTTGNPSSDVSEGGVLSGDSGGVVAVLSGHTIAAMAEIAEQLYEIALDLVSPILSEDNIAPADGEVISDGTINDQSAVPSDGYNPEQPDDEGNGGLLQWELPEAASLLAVNLVGQENGVDATIIFDNIHNSFNDPALGGPRVDADGNLSPVRRVVDFTDIDADGNAMVLVTTGFDEDGDRHAVNAHGIAAFDAGEMIEEGLYDVTYVAWDLVGNISEEHTAVDVYIDPTDLHLHRLSPQPGPSNEIVNAKTGEISFKLSETAAAVSVVAIALDEGDENSPHIIDLAGTQLTNIEETQSFAITASLKDDTNYLYLVTSADESGNWHEHEIGAFFFDLDYIEAVIDNFAVTTDSDGLELAGDGIGIRIRAQAIDGRAATLYEGDALLAIDCLPPRWMGEHGEPMADHGDADDDIAGDDDAGDDIAGDDDADDDIAGDDDADDDIAEEEYSFADSPCGGIEVEGQGLSGLGEGRYLISGTAWDPEGYVRADLYNERAPAEFTLYVVDDITEGGPYEGVMDGTIHYEPQAYADLEIWTEGDTNAGSPFAVHVAAVDWFGNIRMHDQRIIHLGADHAINLPGTLLLQHGVGTVWATSSITGGINLLAYDPIVVDEEYYIEGWLGGDVSAEYTEGGILGLEEDGLGLTGWFEGSAWKPWQSDPDNTGWNHITGTTWVDVLPADMKRPEEPGELVAEDYLGADGLGDNGGFVILTWTVPEGPSADSYRIWREIAVNYDVDEDGNLVELETPQMDLVPWGQVPAAPGVNPMRAVVATLDGVESYYGITAAKGRAKQAFGSAEDIANPYELMSQTMVESKKAAKVDPNLPVFATLTPEALTFIDRGIVPRLKDTGSTLLESDKVRTDEAVRAIDNIAPEAIPSLQVLDTPNDAGGSITVTWVKSESDLMISRTFAGAVGPSTADAIQGVKGYNIYRSVGDEPAALVGQVGPGETSFVDLTAFNGVRYTYSVSPYDEDNITEAGQSATALSIRNRVFDSSGAPIAGLFGSDNKVGFDDFFIFADNFGRQAGDKDFEPAFDLSANNRIDFEDFFIFGDNFGRIAVGISKVVPVAIGLNDNARLDLYAVEALPQIGEEMVLNVSLADFAELKGYGFTVSYDATTFEFLRAEGTDNLLGSAELAQPQVLAQSEGEVSIAGYGDAVQKGELGVDLIFRPIAETEQSLIELTRGELSDDSFALNSVASLGAIEIETRPEVFALGNNYPNPFNPATTIKYQLPEATDVRLEIFNVVGQVVRTLVADPQDAGRYTVQWDATNDGGQPLSSGIYFYRLHAGEFQEVNKMLLLK